MTTRGQATFSAKKRRRRGWLITLAILVVVIGGYLLYAKLSQPPMVKVVWEHEFNQPFPRHPIQPLSQGGVAISYRKMMQFDREGNVSSIYTPPLNICKTKLEYSRVNTAGEFYFTPDDIIIALDASGNKRWEARLPNLGVINNKPVNRCVFITMQDDGNILATYNTGEFAKLDHEGNVLVHTASPSSPVFFKAPIQLTDNLFAAVAQTGGNQQISNVVLFNEKAETIWSSVFPGFCVNSIAKFQDLLIFDMLDGHIYAVDFAGTLQWEYKNPDPLAQGVTAHNYEFEVVEDHFVLVVSDERVVALDHDGNQLWEVVGNSFLAAVAASADTQYVIDTEWSEFKANARQNIGLSLGQYYPAVWWKMPLVPVHPTVFRIDHGRITKSWQAPNNVWEFAGPGADGEFYLYSSTKDSGNLYCVRLD